MNYRAPCNTDAKDRTPILQFASVFRHAEILPYMLPMPMPSLHLPCFVEWTTLASNNNNKKKSVCSKLSTEIDFGKDNSDRSMMSFKVRNYIYRTTIVFVIYYRLYVLYIYIIIRIVVFFFNECVCVYISIPHHHNKHHSFGML